MLNTDQIKYPKESRTYEVLDRVRRIEFKGRMIGKASTQREGGGPRWTDITIYATDGGNYVIQREGKSLVYHRADSACRGGEIVRNEDILEDSIPCKDCRPPGIDQLDMIREEFDPDAVLFTLLVRKFGELVTPIPDVPGYLAALERGLGIDQDDIDAVIREAKKSADPDRYRMEVTMSSADIADHPGKIVPILTYQNRLTTVATDAIRAAVQNDPRLEDIFNRKETIA